MPLKNEKNILKTIKIVPQLLIAVFSFLIFLLVIIQSNMYYNKEISLIKNRYLSANKELIKDDVKEIYTYIDYYEKNSQKRLREDIKNKVNQAMDIINNIYTKNKTKSKKQILSFINQSLEKIKFDNQGYYYIYDLKGVNILHPHKYFKNKNLWNYQDIKGTFVTQEIISRIKSKGETYFSFYWHKTNIDGVYEKITYTKYFKPLGIMIGTGAYIEDYKSKIKEDIINTVKNVLSKGRYSNIFILDENNNILKNSTNFTLNKEELKTLNKKMLSKNELLFSLEKKSDLKYSFFIKKYLPWGWTLGTYFDTNELNKLLKIKKENLRKENRTFLSYFVLIFVGLIFILYFLSQKLTRALHRKFYEYKNKINKEIEKNKEKDIVLNQNSKMASLGEMISNIAHQWRQPLSTISTYASGLKIKHELNLADEEQISQTLQDIVDTTKYMSQTIDDFRNFYKPTNQKEYFKAQELVSQTLKILDVKLNENDILLLTNIEDITFYTYRSELMQVLINIINNAIDELEKIKTKKIIKIDIYQSKQMIFCSIHDNAGGIDEKIKKEIFKAYFTTKESKNGSGIGLYMSKKIINEKIQGLISVKNKSFDFEKISFEGAKFTIKMTL